MSIKRVGSLEIEQDLEHERREWRIERIGWGVLAVIAAAALLGLLGPGPLSSTEAGSLRSGLRIEYNRFERCQAPMEIRVTTTPAAARNGELRLWIAREITESSRIVSIDPQPVRSEAASAWTTFVFRTDSGAMASAGSGVLRIVFHMEPQSVGRASGYVGIDRGASQFITQFFFP